MKSCARIVAELAPGGSTRLVEAFAPAPIAIRQTADGLYLVGSAQGLVGNDQLEIEIVVGEGAQLTIRSAASTVAYASSDARLNIRVSIADGGSLTWRPEALITTARCRLGVSARVDLGEGSSIDWTDECVLGRVDEEPGEIALDISVDRSGAAALRHQLVAGGEAPGWSGPAVLGAYRTVGLQVVIDDSHVPAASGERWALLPLPVGGFAISALAMDLIELRETMAAARAHVAPGPVANSASPDLVVRPLAS